MEVKQIYIGRTWPCDEIAPPHQPLPNHPLPNRPLPNQPLPNQPQSNHSFTKSSSAKLYLYIAQTGKYWHSDSGAGAFSRVSQNDTTLEMFNWKLIIEEDFGA